MIAAFAMGGIALFFALFLLFAYKQFAVEEDPRIAQIEEILPGANCGACGYAGCRQYAEAIIKENAPINKCAPGGEEVIKKIAKITGQAVTEFTPMVARVLCKGGKGIAEDRAVYRGFMSCAVADALVKGDKTCIWGCLGLGDCVRACPFDAMYMGEDGLPVVIEDKCTGCGECAKACPRNIIEIVPKTQKVFVFCKNEDKAINVRKYCKVGCIGCGICVRLAPKGSMELKKVTGPDGKPYPALAVIVNNSLINAIPEEAIKKCPTKSILRI